MSVVLGIIAVIVVLVWGAGTIAASGAMLRVWRDTPTETRKRVLRLTAIMLPIIGALAALVIIEPWGRRTIAYVLLGLAIVTIMCGLVAAGGAAWQSFHPKDHGT